MGKRRGKRRISSDDSLKDEWVGKKGKREEAREENDSSVLELSGVLRDVNSILYGGECDEDYYLLETLFEKKEPDREIVTETVNKGTKPRKMAEKQDKGEPSNADIMKCLSAVHKRLDVINENMTTQTKKLDQVSEKICGLESELRKLWTHVHESEKKTNERLNRVEESVESADFNLTMMTDKLSGLERRECDMMREINYLQSQSMRNNLVFSKIPEVRNESGGPEDTEKILREFLVEKMKLAQELVDSMKFDRVHRMGQPRDGVHRNIVARFTLFKEREMVRRQSGALKGSGHFVFEQFPKEISDRRKQLLPRLKDEQRKGNKAWLSYDTLYVNGRPIKDAGDR